MAVTRNLVIVLLAVAFHQSCINAFRMGSRSSTRTTTGLAALMMADGGKKTMFDKIWASHLVDETDAGNSLIYVDRHLVVCPCLIPISPILSHIILGCDFPSRTPTP